MQNNQGKTNTEPRAAKIRNGIFYRNGHKQFLSATDYPYFRDDARNWADRLDKIRQLGHNAVAFYIPWRHHEISTGNAYSFDFTGETQPNRDIVSLLKLCAERQLDVILKPGPFVHAELNYGGLPDRLCPAVNPAIEPMIDIRGHAFCWGGSEVRPDGMMLEQVPLPAPYNPTFLTETERWFTAVTEQAIRPYAAPHGPVVMLQIANEGVYSNYQRAPWAYDYSRSSLALYARFLQETYGSLEAYNQRHKTKCIHWSEIHPPRVRRSFDCLEDNLAFADWAAYQSYYMREILLRWKSWLPVDLPFVINANPPTDDSFGADAWLSRVNPDDLPGITFGYTNWIGVASKDPSVVERYQLMIKRASGANHEENWSFSKLYEREFAYPSVCFYQTLIQIASGATGYNIYTGVAARHTTESLDAMHPREYPDSAPIDGTGHLGRKAEVLRLMNDFFSRWGAEFLETRPVRPVAFGIYLPYAHAAVWVAEHDWEKAHTLGIPNHGQALQHFQRLCLQAHLDFNLVNLQVADEGQLRGCPTLVLASGRWMDLETQEKLQRYVQRGGRLTLIGEAPSQDEGMRPVEGFAWSHAGIHFIDRVDFVNWTPNDLMERLALSIDIKALNAEANQARIWHYRHPEQDVDYIFVFSRKKTTQPLAFEFRSGEAVHAFQISLPPLSAGVVRFADGILTSALVKGRNEETEQEIVAQCSLDGRAVSADHSGDWLYELGT